MIKFSCGVGRRFSLPLTLVALHLAVGISAVPAQAQGPASGEGRIVGRIVDESTAQPISGAQIYLAGTTIGTLSDMNGRYLIQRVPEGTHDLVTEMIGFAQKTVTGVVVDEGATVALDISIAPQEA